MPDLNQDAYDITINSIGFMLYNPSDRHKEVGSEFVGAVAGIEPTRRPQPQPFQDFSGGAGYSRDFYPGTYSWGVDVDTMSGALMPGGARTSSVVPVSAQSFQITRLIEYGGDLYATAGRYVLRSVSGTAAWGVDGDAGAGVTCKSFAVLNNGLTLAIGTDSRIFMREGGAYTAIAPPAAVAEHLAMVNWTPSGPLMASGDAGLPGWRLVGSTAANTFRYTADAASATSYDDASWAPASSIRIGEGGSSAVINNVISTGHHVYFIKTDGVWDVDSAARSVRLLDFTDSQHADNGLAAIVHNEWLYVGHNQGLRRYNLNLAASGRRQDVPGACEPGAGAHANESRVFGTCTALSRWNGWIIAAFYDGANSYVMFGRDRTEFDRDVPGVGPMVWHGAYAYYASKRITALHVAAPGGVPRLWVALWDGATSTLEYVSLPKAQTALQDLVASGAHRYRESATLYTPHATWGEPTANKHLWSVDVNAERLLSGVTTVNVYAQKDVDGTWVQQGSTFETSPGGSTVANSITNAKQVQFRLDLTGTSALPPVVRALRASADVVHEQTEIRDMQVWFGPACPLRDGSHDDRDSNYLMSQLRALMRTSLVDIFDEEGSKVSAKILPGIKVQKFQHSDGERWTHIVSLSYRIQSRYAFWGSSVWGEFYWA